MHELEIQYFLEGLNSIKTNFYIDAIDQFKRIIAEFPDSELVDDAEYNIALCYYELNQFENSIFNLNNLIKNYPDGTITVLGAGNEFGRAAAKSYLLMINCYLALHQIEKTEEILKLMEEYTDSYVMVEDKKVTYYDLAKKAIEIYKEISNQTTNPKVIS